MYLYNILNVLSRICELVKFLVNFARGIIITSAIVMLLIYCPALKDFDELIKEFAAATEDENRSVEKVVSERRKDLYLDDENASRQGPFFHLLYLPFLVLLSRPVTRRAPRRQPSVSGRRPRRAFAREPPNSSPTTPSAWLAFALPR